MGRGHHDTASPSSLPAKSQCPCFKSGEAGQAAKDGTLMHNSLECFIKGKENPYHEMLNEEQRRQVAYALEIYMTYTDQDREVEVELTLIENDFDMLTFGTADMIYMKNPYCVEVMDFKSGQMRDYSAQTACYARMAMQRYNVTKAQVWVVYGRYERYEKTILNYTDTDYVVELIESITDDLSKARVCDYCDWCVRGQEHDCPALDNTAIQIAGEYSEILDWKEFHPSKMTDPKQVGMGIALAKSLAGWCRSMLVHGERKITDGMEGTGWEMAPGKKLRAWADDADANSIKKASGLDLPQFLKACKVSFGPIDEGIGEQLGLGPSGLAVKKEFNKRFGALVERKQGMTLQKKKETNDE